MPGILLGWLERRGHGAKRSAANRDWPKCTIEVIDPARCSDRLSAVPMCESARFHLKWQKSLGLVVWFVVFGCGGQVVEEPGGDGGQSGNGGTSGSGSDGAGASAGTPKDKLGECVPGVPRARATSCAWISETTCYPSKEAACNCICPLNVAEVYCLSDIPEAGFATEVYCYAP